MFPLLYKYLAKEEFTAEPKEQKSALEEIKEIMALEESKRRDAKKKKKRDEKVKSSMEDIFDIAEGLNQKGDEPREEEKKGSGLFDVTEKTGEDPLGDKSALAPAKTDQASLIKEALAAVTGGRAEEEEDEEDDSEEEEREANKFRHVFEVNVRELKNIRILQRVLREVAPCDKSAKYIQSVFVKYVFPLDDEALESDYISQDKNGLDYAVSMNSCHTYLLEKQESVLDLFKGTGRENFALHVCCYKDGKEVNIGNAQLPVEDLLELVHNREKKVLTYDKADKRSKSSRILCIYGSTFTDFENCIVGKVQVDVSYRREPIKMQSKNEVFLQKETYVNRKIPLAGVMQVRVGELRDLKSNLDNIEYLSRIGTTTGGLHGETSIRSAGSMRPA